MNRPGMSIPAGMGQTKDDAKMIEEVRGWRAAVVLCAASIIGSPRLLPPGTNAAKSAVHPGVLSDGPGQVVGHQPCHAHEWAAGRAGNDTVERRLAPCIE